MVRRREQHGGFALILVLVAVAMALVLGISFTTSTSLKLASSANLVRGERAKYLAESGLNHALYLLQVNPDAIDSSWNHHLGPFYADDTDDPYYIYGKALDTSPKKYVLYSEAFCDGARREKSVTVSCQGVAETHVTVGMYVGNDGYGGLPSSMDFQGDIKCQGGLLNLANIDGNVTSGGYIWDPMRRIRGQATAYADVDDPPTVNWETYKNYTLSGMNCSATVLETDVLRKNDSVVKHGAASVGNPAGVVWLKPSWGRTVYIDSRVDFEGTLLVDGNLIINADRVTLTAKGGFPAIVATGRIYFGNDTDVEINGLVVAKEGIDSLGDTRRSRSVINGGLLCDSNGFDLWMEGQHTLNYDEKKCTIYNFGASATSSLEIVAWGE